ncbi:glycosyltransferase family 2 protein [Candidatus Saccharibacteria bacterium]|nr:MAG: glycosyltransferase family 2 protein [Candidatus Saccharibacteria bacterium]
MSKRSEDIPKISVVMSVYNAQEYLDEAIISILDQSFRDFEFIIIDDGSTDRTNEIIRHYARQDSRVKIVIHKKNLGITKGLNTGFKMARGKYIARMDADDVSLRNRFLKQYVYMERHPDVVVVGALAAYINDASQIYGVEPFLLDDPEIRTEITLRNRQFRHGAVLIRQNVVNAMGKLYDTRAVHYEDFEYWPRLLKHGKGVNLPEVLYLYRKRYDSLTATKEPEMRQGTERVIARERATMNLPGFRVKEMLAAYRTARTYGPASVDVRDEQLRTYLKWQYQLYLYELSGFYVERKDFFSALCSMAMAVLINPFRFAYGSIVGIIHVLQRTQLQKDGSHL